MKAGMFVLVPERRQFYGKVFAHLKVLNGRKVGHDGGLKAETQIQMSVSFLPDISVFVFIRALKLTHRGCLAIISLTAEQLCASVM